jgi:hypothetical protein
MTTPYHSRHTGAEIDDVVDTVMAGGGGGGSGGLSGNGTPEGNAIATPGTTYWDALNHVFYVKGTGTGSTGWEVLIGI